MRTRPTAALLLATLGLVGSACAPREIRTVRVVEMEGPEARSWMGKTEAEVVADWGRPGQRVADGNGGWILSYERVRAWSSHYEPRLGNPSDNATEQERLEQWARGEEPKEFRQELGKFWIGADDRVYREQFDPGHAAKLGKTKSSIEFGAPVVHEPGR